METAIGLFVLIIILIVVISIFAGSYSVWDNISGVTAQNISDREEYRTGMEALWFHYYAILTVMDTFEDTEIKEMYLQDIADILSELQINYHVDVTNEWFVYNKLCQSIQ